MSGSTTVFLKPQDLSTLPGYLAELCHPDRGRSWTKVTIAGFEVLGGNDSPRVCLYDSKDIPEVFREHVVRALTREIFTSNPRRERGRYTLGDAHGLLELTNSNKEYNFTCEGPTVVSCMDLVEAVKAGTIRPTVSYEQVQGGKSAQELERDLEMVRKELGDYQKQWHRVFPIALLLASDVKAMQKSFFFRFLPRHLRESADRAVKGLCV